MASWSQRRKALYSSILIVVFLIVFGGLGFKLFYKAPSCFDGIQNGDEQGIDCGGSCQRLCASAFLPPIVSWSRLENLAPGLYNVATYISNPNSNAGSGPVPYHVILYDKDGVEITEYNGSIALPPKRNTLAFHGAVSTDKRVPTRVLFEFTQAPDWRAAADPLTALTIGKKDYNEDQSGASLIVGLNNTSVDSIGPTDVYAVLYDKDGNALGFSKTIVDGISGYGSAVAPFTWPTSFSGSVISIEVLPVAE
jgi:hypothetical protein